jgi:hypothetical protein
MLTVAHLTDLHLDIDMNILRAEAAWKTKLMTRQFVLNSN